MNGIARLRLSLVLGTLALLFPHRAPAQVSSGATPAEVAELTGPATPLPDAPSDLSGNAAAEAPAPASPAQLPQASSPAQLRDATWKSIPRDILEDQKGIWLFPVQLARGHGLLPAIAITGVTAGLIYADPHTMPYFHDHARNWDDFNDSFDSLITTGEVVALPLSLLAAGYVCHDQYAISTAILAGEAYVDTSVPDLVVKAITRRQRPSDITNDRFTDTFFNGGKSPVKGSSFPSGHSTGAFSVATVIANRYGKHHRWVPLAAYGFATAVSLSRITTSSHFPSDIFLGAALGYTATKYQVLRPR